MLDTVFKISYVAIGSALLLLYVAIFLLYRRIGIRLKVFAMRMEGLGPALPENISLTVTTTDGTDYRWGSNSNRAQIALFGAPGCGSCDRIRPIIGEFAQEDVGVIVIYAADEDGTRRYMDAMPRTIVAVADPGGSLSRMWKIPGTPYMVLTTRDGTIRRKGFVVDRTTVEAFFHDAAE